MSSARPSPRTWFTVVGPSGSDRGYEHRRPREPWLMVPKDGTRALTLQVDPGHPVMIRLVTAESELRFADQGEVMDRLRKAVCRVHVSGNQLVVRGLAPARNIPIDLVHRGHKLRVMVSVKERRTLPIVAHYVEHGPLLKTRMTRERLREVLDYANAFLLQANVRLVLAIESTLGHERIFAPGAGNGPAGKSLGRVVKDTEEYELLVRHRIALPESRNRAEYPPLNVFFVRDVEYGNIDPGFEGEIAAFTDSRGNCIFGDGRRYPGTAGPRKEGETLAHEAVHHLIFLRGLERHPDGWDELHHVKAESDPHNLMADKKLRFHKTRLTRDQIETINDSRAYVPPFGSSWL